MIRSIIIDDEQKSCNILKKMLNTYCKEVEISGIAHNADDGFALIQKHDPELVFLDIEMPDGDGFYFLQLVGEVKFNTIFVTAYDHYALKAIKFSALDYLLKPVDIVQLKQAILKHSKKIHHPKQLVLLQENLSKKPISISKIAIPTMKGYDLVEINDIVWMQASDNYTILNLKNKQQIISSYSLGKMEELLSDQQPFLRIHHSHLINLNFVVRIQKGKCYTAIMADGKELEASVRKKDKLMALLNH